MKVVIFSLGEKGLSVVKAVSENISALEIFCVVGKDSGVVNDFSSELIDFCKKKNIRYALRGECDVRDTSFDLYLAVGWRWIINLNEDQKLIVFHDSLLPKYRGFAPLVNALIKKERITGVTALLGADDYDTGQIILQKKLIIEYPTTIGYEIKRMSKLYAELALAVINGCIEKSIDLNGYRQDEGMASYSLWLDNDDYRINWNNSADEIEHFISCVGAPYLGATALLNNKKIKVTKGVAIDDVKIENRLPGKVIFMRSSFPVVVCGTGLIILTEIWNDEGSSMLPLKIFRSRFG